jgi:hypothetical protein
LGINARSKSGDYRARTVENVGRKMKTSAKITLGAGAVALALFLASLVIWLMGLAFNGIYWLSTEGSCGKYHFSATQTINTCDVYKGSK